MGWKKYIIRSWLCIAKAAEWSPALQGACSYLKNKNTKTESARESPVYIPPFLDGCAGGHDVENRWSYYLVCKCTIPTPNMNLSASLTRILILVFLHSSSIISRVCDCSVNQYQQVSWPSFLLRKFLRLWQTCWHYSEHRTILYWRLGKLKLPQYCESRQISFMAYVFRYEDGALSQSTTLWAP